MNSHDDLCSRCSKRVAVLFRRYSGERLCCRCLRDSLVLKMRRVISKDRLLSERDRMAVLLTGDRAHDRAAELFLELESEFPMVEVTTVSPDELGFPTLSSPGDRWIRLVGMVKRAHLENAGRKLIVPLLAEDSISLFFLFLMGRPLGLVVDGVLRLGPPPGVPTAVVPTCTLLRTEVLALFEEEDGVEDPLLMLIEDLEAASPGAKYNLLSSIDRIIQALGYRLI